MILDNLVTSGAYFECMFLSYFHFLALYLSFTLSLSLYLYLFISHSLYLFIYLFNAVAYALSFFFVFYLSVNCIWMGGEGVVQGWGGLQELGGGGEIDAPPTNKIKDYTPT